MPERGGETWSSPVLAAKPDSNLMADDLSFSFHISLPCTQARPDIVVKRSVVRCSPRRILARLASEGLTVRLGSISSSRYGRCRGTGDGSGRRTCDRSLRKGTNGLAFSVSPSRVLPCQATRKPTQLSLSSPAYPLGLIPSFPDPTPPTDRARTRDRPPHTL